MGGRGLGAGIRGIKRLRELGEVVEWAKGVYGMFLLRSLCLCLSDGGGDAGVAIEGV